MGPDDAKLLAEVLTVNTTLTTLEYRVSVKPLTRSISHNPIMEAGAKAIGEALLTNTTLLELK